MPAKVFDRSMEPGERFKATRFCTWSAKAKCGGCRKGMCLGRFSSSGKSSEWKLN